MASEALIEAFMDALTEKLEAEEFERLTIGPERTSDEVWGSITDYGDLTDLRMRDWDEAGSPALRHLQAGQALARLQARHSQVWQSVAMEATDG
jgi:hypothetical protein